MIDVRNPGARIQVTARADRRARDPPGPGDCGADGTPLTVGEWALLIDDIVDHPEANTEGLWNVAGPDEDDREYDAIFVGGGASGRFGSAFLKARGGRQLTIDAWPFLRVAPAAPGLRAAPPVLRGQPGRWTWPGTCRAGSGTRRSTRSGPASRKSSTCSRPGGMYPHAIMNWQSKEQLDMEYVLNAPATIIDEHTVEVEGQRFAPGTWC